MQSPRFAVETRRLNLFLGYKVCPLELHVRLDILNLLFYRKSILFRFYLLPEVIFSGAFSEYPSLS